MSKTERNTVLMIGQGINLFSWETFSLASRAWWELRVAWGRTFPYGKRRTRLLINDVHFPSKGTPDNKLKILVTSRLPQLIFCDLCLFLVKYMLPYSCIILKYYQKYLFGMLGSSGLGTRITSLTTTNTCPHSHRIVRGIHDFIHVWLKNRCRKYE